jgi:hypothetical protein
VVSELAEYRSRVDNLSERAKTTMLGVRNVVATLLEVARFDAEYERKELDLRLRVSRLLAT